MDVLLIVVILGFGLAAVWLLLFGDREQDIVDDEPTMNTRSRDK